MGDINSRWALRTVPQELRDRYLANGWWTDETLGETVARGLERAGDLEFHVRSATRPWSGTLRDVDRAARRLAGRFRAEGIGPGSVVMFQLPNSVEAGITFWAATYVGAVVVPVVHFYGAKEVGYILRSAQPDVVVTPDRFGYTEHLAFYAELLADRPQVPWLMVGELDPGDLPARATPFTSWLDGADPLEAPTAVDPDSPALIGFTSGTTRDPKGVIHSHRTIGCEVRQLNQMFPDIGPPLITAAPVGHFIGMLSAFLVPLHRLRPVNLVDVWDPAEVIRLMREEHLGMGGGATYFLTSLLDHPDFGDDLLPLMPFAGLGGSTVPLAITERATRLGIRCYRSYGSTEHPSITGCTLDDPEAKRNGTDGIALEGVEVRLAAAGDASPPPPGEPGEISSRGPDLFVGYTDPELTASVFDEDGWYRTGDVGVFDEDGYLSITDRVADVIIRGGENISAQEVEEQLLGIAGVAEAAVVGAPDPKYGERPAAFLRLLPGAEAPTMEAVQAHLRAVGLAKQKWPESLHEVVDLPRTPSGKVQKYLLRQQLAGHDQQPG